MATLQIRVDDTLKKQADTLFSSLGLDTYFFDCIHRT